MLSLLLACSGVSEPIFLNEKTQESLPPDIFFITIDTLRADRLGVYGDQLAKTPNIDSLAKESVLFRESHAVTPLTLPSHASMLTGLWPRYHGLRDNAGFRLDEKIVTVAEVLKTQNYATGAFISAFVLSSAWGLDQGFDYYHDPFHPQDLHKMKAFGELELPAAEVINATMAWWGAQDSPKFAWLHLYDPHDPWNPHQASEPSGYSGEEDPYRAEIAKVDRLLGGVFSKIDKDAVIILTSDHGENLWEGGEREHGVLLNRSVTRVPLLIRPAGGIKGKETRTGPAPMLDVRRPEGVDERLQLAPVADVLTAAKIVDEPVSGVDIAPTIASFAGVEFSSNGIDLNKILNGDALPERNVYAETLFPYFHYGWQPLRMLQHKGLRLEQGTYDQFLEPHSLQKAVPNEALSAQVVEFFGTDIPKPGPSDGDVSEALIALGYMTDQVIVPLEEAPDPREKMETLLRLHSYESLPSEESIRAIRRLIAEEPQLIDAKISLALLLSFQGDSEEALDLYLQILETTPYHSTALNNVVVLAHSLKQYEQAIAFAEQMRELNEQDARAYRYLAAIYAEIEEPEKVISVGLSGLHINPSDPNLNYLVGLSYIFVHQPDKAEELLRSATRYGSRATDINLWQGIAAQRMGEIDKAKKYYEQAIKDMPQDLRARAMAGMMLADADRCEEARTFLINVAKRGGNTDPGIQVALQKCEIQ